LPPIPVEKEKQKLKKLEIKGKKAFLSISQLIEED